MLQVVLRTGDPKNVKACKTKLEKSGNFDGRNGIQKDGSEFLIHTNMYIESHEKFEESLTKEELHTLGCKIALVSVPTVTASSFLEELDARGSSLANAVASTLRALLPSRNEIYDLDYVRSLVSSIPQRYYVYKPLLLVATGEFLSVPEWTNIFEDANFQAAFFSHLAERLRVTHIAVNAPIQGAMSNEMRKPTGLVCLHGAFGHEITTRTINAPQLSDFSSELWATTRQNGIFQTWAPRYTMFSRGNIKEKTRVLSFPHVSGKTIVDLYAGIGYFTFSYMAAGAKLVLCWEINPWSIEGLIRGARGNKWTVKLVRHDEEWVPDDNAAQAIVLFWESNVYASERIRKATAEAMLEFDLSHINLGFLPSSENSWPVAIDLVHMSCTSNVMLHIHENIADTAMEEFSKDTTSSLSDSSSRSEKQYHVSCQHIEKIKTYAPGVVHVCGDFEVSTIM
ncbi:S-adenosyl-L-methionine-dependent methyltransferase [Limtongia smithiae]|uniref:S-adenosyl-L-methionine-dependent methyltransferase n=1 Tax=Limtongia smithiae TaxID=1125753 RepID=UPI0034CD2A42